MVHFALHVSLKCDVLHIIRWNLSGTNPSGKTTLSGMTFFPFLKISYYHWIHANWSCLERPLFLDNKGGRSRQVSLYMYLFGERQWWISRECFPWSCKEVLLWLIVRVSRGSHTGITAKVPHQFLAMILPIQLTRDHETHDVLWSDRPHPTPSVNPHPRRHGDDVNCNELGFFYNHQTTVSVIQKLTCQSLWLCDHTMPWHL